MLSTDGTRVDNVQVIFRVMPTYNGATHFGSRIAFGPDGMLYVTFGERSNAPMRPHAQQLDGHLGKVIRIRLDGTVPQDNPFVGRGGREAGDLDARAPQPRSRLAFDAQGRLWEVEHGTRGGDELNLIEKGKNYGWPLQAYGDRVLRDSRSRAGRRGDAERAGDGAARLLLGSGDRAVGRCSSTPATPSRVAREHVRRRHGARAGSCGSCSTATRVVGEEHLLADRNQRVRDVRQGPDGLLYVVTDETAGALWKLVPRGGELVSWT